MSSVFDVSLGLEGTHVVVTGAAGQIGRVIVAAFLATGAYVSGLDIKQAPLGLEHTSLAWYTVDITNEEELEKTFQAARVKSGLNVSACIAAAGLDLSYIPHHATICDMPLSQWKRTLDVNTTGTFLTARAWLRSIRDHARETTRNVSLVVIGSEAGVFGVPGNADYAASKSAIQYGLVRSLAPEAARVFPKARINAVAPGAVNTPQFRKECSEDSKARYQESEATVANRQSVEMAAVAKACLMLISENFSGNTSGQVVQVDGGKSGRILWQADGNPGW